MVGPGLVLALVLVFCAPLRAERAVGLDAQGVDPLAALNNPSGLDVRDQLGRPVSAQLVAAQMKAAQVEQSKQAAYSSRLPEAAAVAALLEMIEALRLAIRGGGAGQIPQRLFALVPSIRSLQKAVAPPLLALLLTLTAATCWALPAFASPPTVTRSPRVLRC